MWTIKELDEAQVLVLGPDTGHGRQELIAVCTGDNRMANARLIREASELSAICELMLSPESDYDDFGAGDEYALCVECGTRRERPDQQFCDVPGCFAPRVRAALARVAGSGGVEAEPV